MATKLTIATATYGRDSAGKKQLLAELDAQVEKLISSINGSNKDKVINTVKANWSGVDADDFIADFKKSTEEAVNKIKRMKALAKAQIDLDYNEFAKMQQRNVR